MSVLAADDRAYLTAGRRTRYALGLPEAPLIVLNDADTYGCMWACDVPDGWDSPEVTTPSDRRQGGHGSYLGESTYEERVLAFEGTVTAPTPAALDDAYRRLLRALLGQLSSFLRYTHLDETPAAMGLWVRPTGKPRWRVLDDRVADFSFTLVAEDPIKTGSAAVYGPVRLPTVGGEGGYPMGASGAVMPWTSAGGTIAVTVVTVPNAGDEDSHAIYTVTGPVPRPRIQLGRGPYVALNTDLGALDVWVVDTAAGTSTVNGVNRYDAWGAGSTFPLIPAGGDEVRLRSATGGTDQAAGLTVTTAPSWK
jgi:hypothetical protein